MSYQHDLLAWAIDYHFGGKPPGGITTVNGAIDEWPKEIPRPTDAELAQWVATYHAADAQTDPVKNPMAALAAEIDNLSSVATIKAFLKRKMVR